MRRSLLPILITGVITLPVITSAAGPEEINLRRTIVVDVVRKTKDAVVNISTTKIVQQRVNAFGRDPFFQQFDLGQVVRVPANSLGSGFIIHADGYVVTNNHVIDRARQIKVELDDGRKLPAELISADAEADLAILKINSDKPFPTLELGDSSDLMIGEPAIAVGNPLGFSHSVSTGIVSAVHRDLKGQDDKVMLGDLIQTDAAINPGNSGGPLLNAYGQVIGINTAIRGDAQNIGFAIQVNRLRDLIPELMNPAQASKVTVPLKLVEKRHVTPPSSVVCRIESDEKPARQVTAINGHVPHDIIDAYAMLLRAKVGEPLQVTWEDGKTTKFDPQAVPLPDAVVQGKARLGVVVEQLTPLLAEKYKLPVDDGLLITEVTRNGIAAKAGVQAGDILIQLGRYRVLTLKDFSVLLQHVPEQGQLRIGIVRGQEMMNGSLELATEPVKKSD